MEITKTEAGWLIKRINDELAMGLENSYLDFLENLKEKLKKDFER